MAHEYKMSVMLQIQELLYHTLLLTICFGLLIAVIIQCFLNWRRKGILYKNAEKRQENANYDDFSKCTSSSCVRCQNYERLTLDLMERFVKYKDVKSDEGEQDLTRLQISIENSLKMLKNGEDKSQLGDETSLPSLQKPNVFFLRGLSANPWHDGGFDTETSVLEAALPTIKQEYRELLTEQNISENFEGWLENNVPSGMWNVFYLFNQGRRMEDNCSKCPKTVAILEALSVFMKGCAFGNAMFSVLEAGTHITEHYGPCNLRIRCHLGLHVPANCSLTVAHQSRQWQEGRCLLFDDSFLHEARHAGKDDKGPRVVLMMDFWHPDVTAAEKRALCHLFPSQ
ncbi:aspartate beta-hydroxylase domain-containing protein 2-like [Patiria miniata]|uniref:Aspartyl/asparaginy/proline hydroxylase domain-containing protein n=1 Tax=Patiria miniata TaxID=46514 RepID=A0A914A8U7_PATMI|nr:aspartate beta-hydroxylase domain-containing protein 2-like [Patiria miniata]